MKPVLRTELDAGLTAALDAVEKILPRSHCPHSGLCVGAGLVVSSGPAVIGVNYESDSYGLTLCAERAALARAQAENRIEEILSIVLVAKWKDSDKQAAPLTPCGACRQWLIELSARLDRDLPVYSFWSGNPKGMATAAKALMPGAFSLDRNVPPESQP